MSRTYRRTRPSDIAEHDWIFDDYVLLDGKWVRVKLKGKELKKALARFHSDSCITMSMGHKHIKEIVTTRERAKNNMALRNAKKDNYENLVMPVFKDTVIWESW